MPNFLEQLIAEWYEYQGYFVRRNIKVGKRSNGGYDCELDVVVYNPKEQRLIHVEPSMDADSWKKREQRFAAKFKAGKEYIPKLFVGFGELPEIEQIALFVQGSTKSHSKIGGGNVLHISALMNEIRQNVAQKKVANAAIPEQFVILRSLQFAANFWGTQ